MRPPRSFPGKPLGTGSLTLSTLLHLVLGLSLAGTTIVRAFPPGREGDGLVVALARSPRPEPPAMEEVEELPVPVEEELPVFEPELEPLEPEPESVREADPDWRPLPDEREVLRDVPFGDLALRKREAPAVETPAPPEPQPESERRVEPVLLEGLPPDYPRLARRRGWEGTVSCRLSVAADGRVERVEVTRSSGHACLDEAAREALRGWRFRSGLRGVDVLHDVEFRLR